MRELGVIDFISDFCLSTRVAVDASVGELWSDKIDDGERWLFSVVLVCYNAS
jgi:hypothetical protein